MTNFKFILNTVKDNHLLVLWLALIIFHIITSMAISNRTKLMTKFLSLFLTSAIRTKLVEEDVSCIPIKLQSLLEIVRKTTSIHSLNQKYMPRLDLSVWIKKWSFSQVTKLRPDLCQVFQTKNPWDWNHTLRAVNFLSLSKTDIGSKRLVQQDITLDFLVMTWKLQTVLFAKTLKQTVLMQMITSYSTFKVPEINS